MTDVLSVHVVALSIGFLLDLCFGDPRWMPHPVRLIGFGIAKGEKIVRKLFPRTPKGEFWGGMFLALLVVGLSTVVPFLILWGAEQIHPFLRVGLEGLMCYQILSVMALKTESMRVYKELKKGDLPEARRMVSMIVGRDVKSLSSEGVVKAAVETVAENTVDGAVAPLLFMALGGAPLGFFYKAINTLDSMIGYKNEDYRHFGTFAAKLDDVANFVPARIAALAMIASSWILRLDYRNAIKIYKRDRFNHASPNSAQTESVCAGALRIQLAGDAYYFGSLCSKKTIGDAIKEVSYEDIRTANRLLYGTVFITFALCLFGMGIVTWMI